MSVSFESKGGEKVTIPADVILMAVGVGPATDFLKDSGIEIQKGGGVIVDKCIRVKGSETVFAIGKL